MAVPSAKILVLADGDCACVKILGRADFTRGPDLKALLAGLAEKGYGRFIIDLSECALMDSTLLGILVGFGLKMTQNGALDRRSVELLNPNSRIADLLENLGALHLFKVTDCAPAIPESVQAQAPASVNPTREQTTRTCLEAHQSLMAMNPDNVARFKDVTRFLAEDLKNLEKRP
jgi:anti-anti-sigma regulatory factor